MHSSAVAPLALLLISLAIYSLSVDHRHLSLLLLQGNRNPPLNSRFLEIGGVKVPLLGRIGDAPSVMMMMFLALLGAAHIVHVELDVRVDKVGLREIDLFKHEGPSSPAPAARLELPRVHPSGVMMVMVMMMPDRVSGHPHHPVAVGRQWGIARVAGLRVRGRQRGLRGPACFLSGGAVLGEEHC